MNRKLKAALVTGAVILAGASHAAAADEKVTLTGCVVKGEGDGAGYLLVNVPAEPAPASSTGAVVSPGAVGTSGAYANIFYWIDKDDDLKPHIGHRVEIEGDRKEAVKDGEIKIDRKDEWTEIEVKSDGRSMKAQVPNASIVAGPNADRKVDVLVRRVDVDKVRMLAASCK